MSTLSNEIKVLWAKSKPYHPLWKHILDTAAVSTVLYNYWESFEWENKLISFFAANHDIGKIDPYFQHNDSQLSSKLQEAGFMPTADTKCRHERISDRFVRGMLTKNCMNRRVVDAVGMALALHHGYCEIGAREVSAKYINAQNAIWDMLIEVLEISEFPKDVPKDLSAFGMQLAGHIVLSDWIASNVAYYLDKQLENLEEPKKYYEASITVATRWLRSLKLERVKCEGNPVGVVTSPRPVQKQLLETDIPPSLVIIEAPMGEGKTEAAWILSEKWRTNGYKGMYMALPTMATSDNLHKRYNEDYLDRLYMGMDVKLVHGMAWLRDSIEPDEISVTCEQDDGSDLAEAWFRPTRRAMLAAHGVGTVDQSMLAAMNVKFGFLRLYGLVGKVLVIDEIHAYDAYMSAILGNLLIWCACLKIPVVLLSATLSYKQRKEMVEAYGARESNLVENLPYPMITVAEKGKETFVIKTDAMLKKTLIIKTHYVNIDDTSAIASYARDLIKEGGCCCIVVNTVKKAQQIYKEIDSPEVEKLLFHSRYKAYDRDGITSKVLDYFGKNSKKRPDKCILVATQIVEQSLDIDFDYMISEIAPIDLLLQRSGRLHRHTQRSFEPELHVLLPPYINYDYEPEFGATAYVYAKKPLLRTYAILAQVSKIQIPDDIRMLIERCYGNGKWDQNTLAWEFILEADKNWDDEKARLNTQGDTYSLKNPSEKSFMPIRNEPIGDDSDDGNGWRAKTRIGNNDRTAVFVTKEQIDSLREGDLTIDRVRDVYRQSLKIPGYLLDYTPMQGYSQIFEARGKLRGLVLLQLSDEQIWRCLDSRGNCYQISYDNTIGLEKRRI